ncbi:hypothetical protein A6770_20780 [Nostoc minutum NIES-26]|uniref:Uncharacterized protein n=1 Tax=Nostoc minutum NIES-26 TaxID=1844469 RepID=A0A367R4W3_9NOSO|nr:hypothetical protein A6770_20780 [Nostoc minutum NIES-26]
MFYEHKEKVSRVKKDFRFTNSDCFVKKSTLQVEVLSVNKITKLMYKNDHFICKNIDFPVFWAKVIFIMYRMFFIKKYLTLLNHYQVFDKLLNLFMNKNSLNTILINTA